MNEIDYTISNRIAWITLNRPEKRNALSGDLVSSLSKAFIEAEADHRVKVVVLRANGDAFCAGADLHYLQQLQGFSYEQNLDDSNNLKELFLRIYTLKKIVIAQVQGHAIAGGCGLATVCDFSFAVPEAKFGYTEVRIGFIPAIVMVFLLRKIGEMRAKELLLSGDLITAEEAAEIGLINKVSDKEKIEQDVIDFAQHLIETNSANSMMLTKQMIAHVQSLTLESALDYAAEMNAKARLNQDCKLGIESFLAKKKIEW